MELTRVRARSDARALTIGGVSLSYAELADVCGGLATRLEGLRRVAFWAENTLEACVAALTAIESGVEAVALNPKLGSAELAHILGDCEPEAILAAPEIGSPTTPADDLLAAIPRIEVDLTARGALPPAPEDVGGPESVALIIYTSGTTGPPKGVLMPRRAIAANLDALADAWAWTADDVLAHALPIFHVHGLVLGLVGPLRRGGELRHLGRFSPEAVAGALAGGATMVFGVPTMYHRLAQAAEDDAQIAAALGSARLLVSGSAGLPAATFGRIERCSGQRIVERYGLTETIMNTAVRADGERRPGEVGRPLPGVEVRITTDEGDEAPADGETIGEVHVHGPNLFLGYLNRPDATAEVLRDGWFATGDLATRAPDGYLRIVGRKSTDLIKTGGYKVGAGEVESALLEHPQVAEAAVTAAADEDLGERIVAWIVAREPAAPPSERALADHVAATLAPHKRPREVRFLDELPRNAMGKVVKQRLGTT